MDGTNVGRLNIFVQSTSAGRIRKQLIWALLFDQGSGWKRAAVAVVHTGNYTVSITE